MTTSAEAITPFEISFGQSQIDDLITRLAMTRWPDDFQAPSGQYGADLTAVKEVVEYWQKEYSWADAERELNQFSHFRTTIDGEQIHFIHMPSDRDDATPLLLTHGWPGAFAEFLDLIEPLRNPPADQPAFHVVVPSLPGFTLSGPTVTHGVSPKRIAGMWIELMACLGYERYLAQGGDWGSIITGWVGQLDPEHCLGIHVNMIVASPPKEVRENPTEDETAKMQRMSMFRTLETGYQAIQGTKPQSLAFAHADSPSGWAAWLLEKFTTWTDNDGDAFDAVDRDRFLTIVTLYWLTNTAGSAARIYYEYAFADGGRAANKVTVPTGMALFPEEIYQATRRWAENNFNVVHWSEFDKGGHFAAMEQPDALLGDIRSFARSVGR